MIHCTLTQNKLRVEQDTDVLPFQYSNNINIQFIKDSTYENYVVTPYYAWVPTKSISPRKLDAFALPLKDGVFTLPMNAFVKDGYLGIAFSLTDGNEVLQTDPVYLAVQSSVGSNNILPENDSWQLVVIDTVNSYIELNVNDKLQALIKEVAKLDENSAELQKEVNELIDKVNKMLEDGEFIPEHKWENTFLHFKNPDGSWDNGVNLKGPSGVYFGNDIPPEDGEYNVWVLPDGTPDFEIYADQVKTEDGSNVQEKIDNTFSLGVDQNGIPNEQDQYGMIKKENIDVYTIEQSGMYLIYGTEQLNTPYVSGWYLDVKIMSNTYKKLIAYRTSTEEIYECTCNNGTWKGWKLIAGRVTLWTGTYTGDTTLKISDNLDIYGGLMFAGSGNNPLLVSGPLLQQTERVNTQYNYAGPLRFYTYTNETNKNTIYIPTSLLNSVVNGQSITKIWGIPQ
ncbi:pyocin knob domain-containing protein [Breznakia pachnodae]|uniref:Uncharacterized protein n=1 Tax=Breznakia pachnodae TaxID=265178 RepID=A0ABU0DYI5_9FIRM|nr:pyocin knob domain-containing protein [Breznakia pachnodae]MDQ0359697.1 hypothetical protein [Breznakia pachnodae]